MKTYMYSTCEAYPKCLWETYEWQVNEVFLMGTADLYKYFGVPHGYFQSASTGTMGICFISTEHSYTGVGLQQMNVFQ